MASTTRTVVEMESNICNGIKMLKKEAAAKLREGKVMELYFEANGASTVLKLRPVVEGLVSAGHLQ